MSRFHLRLLRAKNAIGIKFEKPLPELPLDPGLHL